MAVVLRATINLKNMCRLVRMLVKHHIRRNDRYVARVVVVISMTMIQEGAHSNKVCINYPRMSHSGFSLGPHSQPNLTYIGSAVRERGAPDHPGYWLQCSHNEDDSLCDQHSVNSLKCGGGISDGSRLTVLQSWTLHFF